MAKSTGGNSLRHKAGRGLVRYLWAAPNTLVGLPLMGVALASGGRVRIVDGVLEVSGGALASLLRGVPIQGGALAMTLGHIVVGRSEEALALTRDHERVHVRQCERWGPFFIPAYFLAGLVAILRGGNGYRDNPFEREARVSLHTQELRQRDEPGLAPERGDAHQGSRSARLGPVGSPAGPRTTSASGTVARCSRG